MNKEIGLLEKTYIAILQIDSCAWRIHNQKIYCELRDAIAEKTGKPPQQVQEECEEKAAKEKYELTIKILHLPSETRPSSALAFMKK